MNTKIQDIFDFIDRAVKSRKYPESTAQGLRAALKLFDSVLNDEERGSLDLFQKNIEQIYRDVSSKHGGQFSAGSLAAYKSRVLKVMSDFEKYGVDPTKMAGWSPKVVKRGPRKKTGTENTADNESHSAESIDSSTPTIGMHRIELALRPDKKFLVVVPMDITSTEALTLKAVIDSLTVKSG